MGIDPHPVPIVKSEIGLGPGENRIDLQIQQSDFIHRHCRFTDPAEEFGSLLNKSGKRKKYTCGCGCNVWGKSGLVLRCGLCDTDFTEQ